MNKFVVVSFGLMAWVFWELSGGADFEPKSKRLAQNSDQTPVAAAKQVLSIKDTPSTVTANVPLTKATQPEVSQSMATASPLVPAATTEAAPAGVTNAINTSESEPQITVASLTTGLTSFTTPGTPLFNLTPAVTQDAPDVEPPAITPEALPDLREVSASRVNMRAGPGTSYNVVTVLDRGHTVQVLDQNNGGWLKLRDNATGQIGWMAARMVSAAN